MGGFGRTLRCCDVLSWIFRWLRCLVYMMLWVRFLGEMIKANKRGKAGRVI
jgi:hypothetical protein